MDITNNGTAPAPRILVRSGLVMMDLAAFPLLGIGMAGLLGLALGSLGIAAGSLNFLLGLRFLDYFPVFPVVARVLSGFSMLAFAAFLAVSTLFLVSLYRGVWQRFWSWHGAAWAGTFATHVADATGHKQRARVSARLIGLFGLVFLGLLAATSALMFLLARGPFWHVWGWFT